MKIEALIFVGILLTLWLGAFWGCMLSLVLGLLVGWLSKDDRIDAFGFICIILIILAVWYFHI